MSDINSLRQFPRSRANSAYAEQVKSGRAFGEAPPGEKRRVSEKLVTHPHNSAPNLPASVFFGTSGVPGDGCAAPSLTSDDLSELWAAGARMQACANSICKTPDECLMTGCARMAVAAAIEFVARHGPLMVVDELMQTWFDGAALRQDVVADWRSQCGTGEEL